MCMNTKDTNGQSNKHFTPEIFLMLHKCLLGVYSIHGKHSLMLNQSLLILRFNYNNNKL